MPLPGADPVVQVVEAVDEHVLHDLVGRRAGQAGALHPVAGVGPERASGPLVEQLGRRRLRARGPGGGWP